MDKLDFKTFDEKFDNTPIFQGTEQSEIDEKRDAFIAENSLDYCPSPAYPKNIAGNFQNPKNPLQFFFPIEKLKNSKKLKNPL